MSYDLNMTVDGIDYKVEVACDGGMIFIYDVNGQKVADAEYDHGVEMIFVSTYSEENGLEMEETANYFEFKDKGALPLARWIVGALLHP